MVAVVIAVGLIFALMPGIKIYAKGGTQYYYCIHTGDAYEHTELMKAYIKNGKLYVKGCIQKTDKNCNFIKYVGSKNKVKSWKLKKGYKLLDGSGEGYGDELSSIEVVRFNSAFNTNDTEGYSCFIKIKNNKVVKIICYS